MASLEKMSIMGMRSYGCNADDEQTLKFLKPVTLILGDNGCGKSTIIECLRYITAQKEPSGKGVLIHDPKLATCGLVKAQVKLQLRDSKNQVWCLQKIQQATRTTRTLQTKSVDSVISKIIPGQKEAKSVSNRCTDFTPEVMKIMGVSKAIVENVIFCTQEDANWPLDTDQKLKEKFDQIFDSDKYNKCLKKVRDQRKIYVAEKKTREIELKHLKECKSAAGNKRKEQQKLEKNITSLDEERELLEKSLEPLYQKISEVNAREKQISSTYSSCEMMKNKLKDTEKAEVNLLSLIRKGKCEFNGTDEDLEMALVNCDAVSRNVDELKADLLELQNAEKRCSSELSKKLSKVGELGKEVEINGAKIEERKKKMEALGNDLKMNNPHLTQDGLARRINAKQSQIAAQVEQFHAEEEKLQGEVNKAREAVMEKEMEVKKHNESLEELIKEREALKKEMQNMELSQVRREEVADELRIVEADLARLKASDVGKMAADLKRLEMEMEKLESQIGSAEEELKEMAEHAQKGSRLDQLKLEFGKKSTEIRRLKNNHEETLIRVLENVPEAEYKKAVQNQVEELASSIRNLRTRKAGVEKESTTAQNNLRTVRTSLQSKRAELQAFSDQVSELTDGEELSAAVKRLEEKLNELQDEKGALSSGSLMYEQYIKRLKKEKPCCPLCERDFAAEAEAKKLIADLQLKTKKIPGHLERIHKELDEKQEKLRSLLALHSQYDKMEALKEKEIPALAKSLEDSQKAITKCQKDLDEIDKELHKSETDRDLCTGILGDMSLLDRLLTELAQLKKEIEALTRQLPPGWSNELLKAAEDKKSNLVASSKNKNEERVAAQRKLNSYNDQLMELQSKKNSLDAEDLKLRNSCGQQQQQQDRLMALRTSESNIKQSLAAANQAVLPLKEVAEQKSNEWKLAREDHKRKEREMQAETDRLLARLKEIERLKQETDKFEEGKKEELLLKLKNDVRIDEEDTKKRKLEMESINCKLGDLSKSVVRRRELEDNKAYREKIRERETLKKEVKALERKFKGLNYEELVREKRQLKAEEERIGQRKAEISGNKGGILGQIASLKRELTSNMYLDIDDKYKRELCEMHIADALSCDLLRYAVAMDYAMGVYHQRQLEKVNSIIREYWRKIYRGNDIDYIEVIAEQATITETKRNFNYKLVQVRGDIKLDLRNRCSAGQKMLTSLIVRMALAEVFSNNCGILTLDEPTTNLDKKNIQNLAIALNELITMKRGLQNSNFQLIVITHDRAFLEEVIAYNEVDEYVEVSRNNEGKSQLKVHRVQSYH